MKIFILNNVDKLTDNYHSGGGIVIIADSVDHAKELVSIDPEIQITDKEWGEAKVYETFKGVVPEYFVFPDAGCC